MLFENHVVETVYIFQGYIFETYEDLEEYLDTREYLRQNKTKILENSVEVEDIDSQDYMSMLRLGYRLYGGSKDE